MPEIKKYLKMTWWKNNDDNGGAMLEAIKSNKDDEIVIHSQTKKDGRLWTSMKPDVFLDLLSKNHGLYEVITKFPHKVYFDIDKEGKQNEIFLELIKNTIKTYFPKADLAISGSIKETKTSFHIVLQNYLICNEEDRMYMRHLTKYLMNTIDESFDWKVYTKNRNMKCINQSKDDGRVQEIFENADYKAHCITTFLHLEGLPFSELNEEVEEDIMITKSTYTFDLGELPKLDLVCPDDFDVVKATPSEILALLPLSKENNHSYTHLIARYCFNNGISFETFLSWLSQKHESIKTNDSFYVNKWKTHWSNMHKFPTVERGKIIKILHFYYPLINIDIHFRQFAQTFILPPERITKIETISQSQFKYQNKYAIFNVGMGGGKTAQTITYLKNEPLFLWIAPNIALSTNTHKRFDDDAKNRNILNEVSHYEKFSAKHKKSGVLCEQNKLIICLNSLHYININKATYNTLVIDEIETLLDKFLGDFLDKQGKKKEIWNTFINLFRNAKKVILLDAFITSKTINFIKLIEGKKYKSFDIFERMNEPQTRTIKYMSEYHTMLADMVQKLKDGSKLFIFYPYKNRNVNFVSMDDLMQGLENATGKKGIYYNADISDKLKKGLKDVNTNWKDFDFVITNNIITCGINYENTDFDYKYLFIAKHNTPRDIIQVSYRARHLNTGIIKICYLGRMNQINTWLNDCKEINCPIYTSLYENILIEHKAPLKRSFQLFCVKAHYKQETDKFKIDSIIELEMQEIFQVGVGIDYLKIPEIDQGEAKFIEEKCFQQLATMMDKFSLSKYYFKKSFIDEVDVKALREIWDEKYVFFLKKMSEVLMDENHIFHKIANQNKLPQLFPVNILKVKLTDEIKDEIFNKFAFKYITKGSATQKILTEVYNTFFGKHIIKTELDQNKHTTYTIDEKIYDYFDFAKQNCKLDKNLYKTYNQLYDDLEPIVI